jgi:hypothetical protein
VHIFGGFYEFRENRYFSPAFFKKFVRRVEQRAKVALDYQWPVSALIFKHNLSSGTGIAAVLIIIEV